MPSVSVDTAEGFTTAMINAAREPESLTINPESIPMSISSLSSNYATVQSPASGASQAQQDFKSLSTDLQSGNLAGAQ